MRRCALILTDDRSFRSWISGHLETVWPNTLVEFSRLVNAPIYLDRTPLDRYKLIVVHLSFRNYAEVVTCIFLMRILKLQERPEIMVVFDDLNQLKTATTTRLGSAPMFLREDLNSHNIQAVLQSVVKDAPGDDGAPEIPGYRILNPIAGTYNTTVYRAVQLATNKPVAIKLGEERKKEATEKIYSNTLRGEYEILSKLRGDYVASVLEYGEIENLAYLVMEYFGRGTLSQFVADNGRTIRRVDYLLKTAEAIRHVHKVGFLHLDIKPQNIMVRDDGVPVLIDFGISRRTVAALHQDRQQFSLGSPHFMSPEQVRGEPLDERSDLYSFGAVWFRILTGHPPFMGRSFFEIFDAQQRLPPPTLSEALRHYQPIVDATLASAREDRFSSADELIDAIHDCAKVATEPSRDPLDQEADEVVSLGAANEAAFGSSEDSPRLGSVT